MTTDNFCFYLQSRLIRTSQTGGQWYSDTSPFSIPWPNHSVETLLSKQGDEDDFCNAPDMTQLFPEAGGHIFSCR
jgi:hypothetical protein